MAPTPLRQRARAAAPTMQAADGAGWQTVSADARGRAATVKADQDATTAVMAVRGVRHGEEIRKEGQGL